MIYPFTCPRCHAEFTVTMSVAIYEKLRNKMACPVCKNYPAKRDLTAVSVHYVGDGFTKSVKEEK